MGLPYQLYELLGETKRLPRRRSRNQTPVCGDVRPESEFEPKRDGKLMKEEVVVPIPRLECVIWKAKATFKAKSQTYVLG